MGKYSTWSFQAQKETISLLLHKYCHNKNLIKSGSKILNKSQTCSSCFLCMKQKMRLQCQISQNNMRWLPVRTFKIKPHSGKAVALCVCKVYWWCCFWKFRGVVKTVKTVKGLWKILTKNNGHCQGPREKGKWTKVSHKVNELTKSWKQKLINPNIGPKLKEVN